MPVEGIKALNLQHEIQIFVNGERLQHAEVFIKVWIHPIDAIDAWSVSKAVSTGSPIMSIVLIVESGLGLICGALRSESCAVPEAVHGRIRQTSLDHERVEGMIRRRRALDRSAREGEFDAVIPTRNCAGTAEGDGRA